MIWKLAFKAALPVALSICVLWQTLEARAQIAVVAPAAREMIDAALGRFAARDAAGALGDGIATLGGKTAVGEFRPASRRMEETRRSRTPPT